MTRLNDQAEEIFVEIIDFGKDTTAAEMVTKNDDGSFTVFVNARYAYARQQEALEHAIRHINQEAFDRVDVQQIEAAAHQIAEKQKTVADNYPPGIKRAIRQRHMTKAEKIRSLRGKIQRARLRMIEAQDEATYEKYRKKVWENEIRLNWLLDKDPFEDFR